MFSVCEFCNSKSASLCDRHVLSLDLRHLWPQSTPYSDVDALELRPKTPPRRSLGHQIEDDQHFPNQDTSMLVSPSSPQEEDLLWDYNPTYDSSLMWEFRLESSEDCEESFSTNESRLLIPKHEISSEFDEPPSQDSHSNRQASTTKETEKDSSKSEDCNNLDSEHLVLTRNGTWKEPNSKEDVEILAQNRGNAKLRYMEKKKTRRYDNHIRYQSRKAMADTRKRVKGRFVKSTEALTKP